MVFNEKCSKFACLLDKSIFKCTKFFKRGKVAKENFCACLKIPVVQKEPFIGIYKGPAFRTFNQIFESEFESEQLFCKIFKQF